MNKKIVSGLVFGVLVLTLIMPMGRALAMVVTTPENRVSTQDANFEALQRRVSELLEMIKSLQAQIEALRSGQVRPVEPPQFTPPIIPIRPEPERGWDTISGALSAQGPSIQQWGTHQVTEPTRLTYPTQGGKNYLVKAVNDEVLSMLKRYEGQNVTLWGQLQYQNLEGGFWGFVAKKVYVGSTTCPLPAVGTKIGYTDESVKVIQEVLKTDKSVYPEGLVTGYYGPLTAKAVSKFQTQAGLPATGVLDNETKERIGAKLEAKMEGSTASVEVPLIRCPIPPKPIPPPTPDQGFKVYSPSAGEIWTPGQAYKITWSQTWPTIISDPSVLGVQGSVPTTIGGSAVGGSVSVGNTTFAPIGAVRITLHKYIACLYSNPACLIAEAAPYVISEKTDNDGVFEWSIPADIASQYQGKMIITVSAVDGGFSGRSAVFVIGGNVLPDNQVKVYSPSTGETWYKGKTYEIKWTSPIRYSLGGTAPSVGTAKIALGQAYNSPPCYAEPCPAAIAAPMLALYPINANAPDVGSYKWTIPSDLPSGYTGKNMVIFVTVNAINSTGQSGMFAVAESQTSNLPPVVSGVSGPTSLKVGETGTWTVKAYDPENGSLSYSVNWGDEPSVAILPGVGVAPAPVQNTATFTHVYNTAGTYTPVFYVTDDRGQQAKTSMSVQVGGGGTTNSPPKITGIPAVPSEVKVGQVVSFSWTATDPDGDKLGWSVDWGDNSAAVDSFYCIALDNCTRYTASHAWTKAGIYTVVAKVWDTKGGSDTYKFNVTMSDSTTVGYQILSFKQGWNFISFNRLPEGRGWRNIFRDDWLRYVDVIRTFEAGQELVYDRASNTQTIVNIEFDNGYKVYANQAFTMYVYGYAPKTSELTTRLYKVSDSYFNFVGNPSGKEIDIASFFRLITDKVTIVKEGSGAFWIPGVLTNSLTTIKPGQGYEVNVKEDIDFVFPLGLYNY